MGAYANRRATVSDRCVPAVAVGVGCSLVGSDAGRARACGMLVVWMLA